MRSLRLRLLLLLGAEIIAAALLQFGASHEAAMNEANKLFDYHLQQMAMALEDSDFPQQEAPPHAHRREDAFDVAIRIWSDSGAMLYQAGDAPPLPRHAAPGFSMELLPDSEWRIYTRHAGARTIQVAQRMEARQERASGLALKTLSPTVIVAVLSLLATMGVISAALAPLNRIGRDLAARNAGSLAPVSEEGVPAEVSRLTAELNSLLARLDHALQSQQHFIADAAHELRSPLTALKLQVQTLMRAKDDEARMQGAQRLLGGIDRASRLVEQLLLLARQDPLLPTQPGEPVDLLRCIELAAGDVAPFAAAKDIDVRYDCARGIAVAGDAEAWRVMIRNLLDNAVRYTPAHGVVMVTLSERDGTGTLAIEDSGPGISEVNRARVFDRFYRVPGTAPGGSGLGLAIVKAIAARHGVEVALGESATGGLAVRLEFGMLAQARTQVEMQPQLKPVRKV
ncbi:ATP-binding protein [Noviherbaspirillum pedocola]|uniref:histidine kinase n=1 Tax=Noviherbaspirillum pedocola TaxID=2801341 RepID=A0A934W9Y1_9BURK|nr:ATP-binding protein [Noviherbaspirillum pedocola]MBK4737799.1 sensor histidine kinase N-terminal domain-containing protein [Noviherbaspirillum pedocola]